MSYPGADDSILAADVIRPMDENTYPGIVLVHGGSWGGRSRKDMRTIGKFLASQGFVVLNLSYRFAPKHRYPAQVEDVDRGVSWFKAAAFQWKMDSSKMGGWGYSAGGHLIAQWALLESKRMGAPVLQAVVAGGAPFDLSWYPFSPIITLLLDGFRDQRLREYQEASPVTHVGPWAPPMFLYHGAKDRLVEAVQSSHMQNRLRESGVEAQLHLTKPWGHLGAFLYAYRPVQAGMEFLVKYLKDG